MAPFRLVLTCAACCALAIAARPAAAQGQAGGRGSSPPPGDQASAGEPAADADPERLRARLSRILEHLEDNAERVRSAIAALDETGSVDDAIEELGGPMNARRFSEAWERWGRAGREGEFGGRGGPPGRGGDEFAGGPPSGPDAERILEFLQANAPEVAARIEGVRAGSPRRAEALLARLAPRVQEILIAQDRDPALAEILTREFKVGMEMLEVGGEMARARRDGDQQTMGELRPRLRELAAEQVDLRLARREHEITALADRIAALREELDRQREDREALIDQMIERAGEEWRDAPPGEPRRQRRGGRE